jgi:hypothetical protein
VNDTYAAGLIRKHLIGSIDAKALRFVALAPLKLALAVYPEARVNVDERTGLILYPSPPPVGERKALK